MCGTPLPDALSAGRQERKVLTVLFADLVGFTSRSETMDPEDVRALLAPYWDRLRTELEHFGGTVEKFIGDAVVALFGAPVAHEDDPERAVRAALAIREWVVEEGELEMRIGVNTGEALVVGDAINTAARIQSVAPEMGVAVGLATWESTHLAIDYEELPPATLKGKSAPVRVFHATAVRASIGVDLSRSHAGAYVGREDEIARLHKAFDDAVASGQARFVVVVGEPGIGKSRITTELAARVLAENPSVAWRQGRCLPYGDGVTFWALGEILKAHAGILDGDDAETVTAKVTDAIPATTDAEWLRDRLLPLVGAAAPSANREESFGAWRAFLEGIARANPAVIVFEDIHWADDALLAFLAYLAASPPDAALLVLLTARPTLDEHHPSFAANLPGLGRIDLRPLTDDETQRLITGILGAVVPLGLHGPILERAQGNPLYAEEFVRLLVDRDLLVRSNGNVALREDAAIPMPDSITSLLAARLDALPPGRKALLADAAVIGKVFWSGGVAAMEGRTPEDVNADLSELARIELVRPAVRSSMAGEAEYAFWHVLARDVAYQQLPRASRAARHQAAGDWLEAKAGGRVEDIAQLLAHHYSTALDLARAAGEENRAHALEPCALRYLRMAGQRAVGLDTVAAISFLERALELAPQGADERPEILAAFGDALDQAGRHEEAAAAFEEAIAGFEAHGDDRRAARLMLRLQLVYVMLRDARLLELTPRALEILTSVEPSEDLVLGLTQQAIEVAETGDYQAGLDILDRALDVAEHIGMPPPARTLRRRAHLRLLMGDLGCTEDFERAIAAAKTAGDAREVGLGALWYGGNLALLQGNTRGRAVLVDGLEYVRSRGLSSSVQMLSSGLANTSVEGGLFDEALTLARETLPAARASGANGVVAECLGALMSVGAMRGDLAGLPQLLDEFEALNMTYEVEEFWVDLQVSIVAAYLALGRREPAAAVIERVLSIPGIKRGGYRYLVGAYVRVATELQMPHIDGMLEGVRSLGPAEVASRRWAEGSIAQSHGDHAGAAVAHGEAAAGFNKLEIRPWEALTQLGLGRSLAVLGRHDEAEMAVGAARAIFVDLRAAPWIEECDRALVGQAS